KLYDLYQEAHTPWEWHEELFAHARRRGIHCFSSPFDPTAVDFLQRLDAPAFKIASFEIVDLALIRKAAATRQPVSLSTGLADDDEIGEAVTAAGEAGAGGVALLHCVSGYPTPYEDANLARLARLAKQYDCVIGLSDHTPGTVVPVAAVALGAAII